METNQGDFADNVETSGKAHQRIRRGVIGIISRNDELLLIRRAEGIPKGGLWCFPGGHVEAGETSKVAVVRELSEELGLTVKPTRRVGSVRVLDSGHVLAIWRVDLVSGPLRLAPAEVAEARWLNPQAIRTLPCGIASNQRVLELLGL